MTKTEPSRVVHYTLQLDSLGFRILVIVIYLIFGICHLLFINLIGRDQWIKKYWKNWN
jgi:hypothetical protein